MTLAKARLYLIERVNEALLKDLIDGLRKEDPPVLTEREVHEILQTHQENKTRIGQLVDIVCKKGNTASKSLITILREKDAKIAKCISLH